MLEGQQKESPQTVIKKGGPTFTFEQYLPKKNTLLNTSGNEADLSNGGGTNYNPIRDNAYFNRFTVKYNEKLS